MYSIDRGSGVEIDRTLAVSAFLESFASVQRQNGQGVWGHSHKKRNLCSKGIKLSQTLYCVFLLHMTKLQAPQVIRSAGKIPE